MDGAGKNTAYAVSPLGSGSSGGGTAIGMNGEYARNASAAACVNSDRKNDAPIRRERRRRALCRARLLLSSDKREFNIRLIIPRKRERQKRRGFWAVLPCDDSRFFNSKSSAPPVVIPVKTGILGVNGQQKSPCTTRCHSRASGNPEASQTASAFTPSVVPTLRLSLVWKGCFGAAHCATAPKQDQQLIACQFVQRS